jgi:protein-tyrosine-phosphatase
MLPGTADRVMLLDDRGDIADPVGGPIEQYEQVARQIEQALTKRLDEVSI